MFFRDGVDHPSERRGAVRMLNRRAFGSSGSLVPSRHRVTWFVHETILAVYRNDVVAVDLYYGLGQVDLPYVAELDPSIQALKVDPGDGITNLLRIQGSGSFDRFDKRFYIGHR